MNPFETKRRQPNRFVFNQPGVPYGRPSFSGLPPPILRQPTSYYPKPEMAYPGGSQQVGYVDPRRDGAYPQQSTDFPQQTINFPQQGSAYPASPPPGNPSAGQVVNQSQSSSGGNVVHIEQVSPNDPLEKGWDTSLFDCLDDPVNAAVVCLCYCCYIPYLTNKMREFCLLHLMIGPACLIMALRIKLRNRFRIRGSILGDCLSSSIPCIHPCVICQLGRQMNILSKEDLLY